MIRTMAILLAMVSATAAFAEEGRPLPLPDQVKAVNGVEVTLKPTIAFSSLPDDAGVDVLIVVDLSDLQAKMPAIAAAFPLPKDSCAAFKPDNVMASITRARLAAQGQDAILELGIAVEIWSCREDRRPRCRRSPGTCEPIRTRLAQPPLAASLPVTLGVPDPQHIAVEIGTPDITFTGRGASLIDGALSIAGVNVDTLAREAILKAIDPDALLAALPDQVRTLKPTVASAAFADVAGALTADIHLTTTAPEGGLATFLQSFAGTGP